jgi:c-di-GMP-related signal transduction protein
MFRTVMEAMALPSTRSRAAVAPAAHADGAPCPGGACAAATTPGSARVAYRRAFDRSGHELAVRLVGRARSGSGEPDAAAPDSADPPAHLCDAYFSAGIDRISPALPLFVRFDAQSLLGAAALALNPDRIIIELASTVQPTPQLLDRVMELSARGYAFGVADCRGADDPRLDMLPVLGWVCIDLASATRGDVNQLLARVRAMPHLRALAVQVDTLQRFRDAREQGLHGFEGDLLARCESAPATPLPSCARTVLERFKTLLAHGVSDEELAEEAASDPALVLRLLVVARHAHPQPAGISTLEELLCDLDHSTLSAWIECLLACTPALVGRPSIEWSLAALQRSRFMALLAQRLHPWNPSFGQQAALLGLLSCARESFPARMTDRPDAPLVHPELEQAWSRRTGALGRLLELARDPRAHAHATAPGDFPGSEPVAPCTADLPALQEQAARWAVDSCRAVAVRA